MVLLQRQAKLKRSAVRLGYQLKHAAIPRCRADLLAANLDLVLRRKAEGLASLPLNDNQEPCILAQLQNQNHHDWITLCATYD